MRIDRLTIQNFKGFESFEIAFDPHFNLLVGDNASGKTSVLDALSILLDSWILGIKGNEKGGGIDSDQVRLKEYSHAGVLRFEPQLPVQLQSTGEVMGQILTWSRERISLEGRTKYVNAKSVTSAAREAGKRVAQNGDVTLPLVGSYGTERRWFESLHRDRHVSGEMRAGFPSRLDGYLDCNQFEIQEQALLSWIRAQHLDNTEAMHTLDQAIAACVVGATSVSYAAAYDSVVVEIHSRRELYRNLSDGQRVMFSLVGDLVRRAHYLNAHLGQAAVEKTPGVVLIDELDLHLHPKWQRLIIPALKSTFPSIQFITTTHSPQLIGEALPSEVRVLAEGNAYVPPRSFGLDSSRALEEIQGARKRNPGVESLIHQIAEAIEEDRFEVARKLIADLEEKVGPNDAEVTRARSLMKFMEAPQ